MVMAVNRTNRTDRPTSEPVRHARDRSGRRSDQNAAIGTPAMGRSTDSTRHGHSRSLRGAAFPSSGSFTGSSAAGVWIGAAVFAGSGEVGTTGPGSGVWIGVAGPSFGVAGGI